MKIIIVGTAHPYRGGLSAFNERLAHEYLKHGDDVEIYTFSLQYPKLLFPGKTQYSDQPAPKDLTIHQRVNSINPINWVRVGNEIARKRPDILITKYWLPYMAPCLGTIERRVRKNKHTRIVSILDNVIPHEKRITDKMLSSYFVGSTDAFVAMSRSVLNDLSIFDNNKPRQFCPHPLYDHYGEIIHKTEARKRLGLDPDGKYILFFGFIRDYKGLDLLLDAMADSRIRQQGVKLIVAGEFYNDSSKYMEQIERLGIKDSVVLCTDFIPDDKVGDYFCSCDIVTQPYKSATQSGVTQIAFHYEKPMIVTNVGGLAEIVPDGKVGFVVEPDSSELADAIVRYYDGNLEQSFSLAVKEEKEKYSWSKMVEAIGNFV